MVARRGKKIVGVMAVWDQAAYKQDIVDAYSPTLRRLRPVYNLVARLLGAHPLTPPGQAIQLAFAACICIANDDPARDASAAFRLCEERVRTWKGVPDAGPVG